VGSRDKREGKRKDAFSFLFPLYRPGKRRGKGGVDLLGEREKVLFLLRAVAEAGKKGGGSSGLEKGRQSEKPVGGEGTSSSILLSKGRPDSHSYLERKRKGHRQFLLAAGAVPGGKNPAVWGGEKKKGRGEKSGLLRLFSRPPVQKRKREATTLGKHNREKEEPALLSLLKRIGKRKRGQKKKDEDCFSPPLFFLLRARRGKRRGPNF